MRLYRRIAGKLVSLFVVVISKRCKVLGHILMMHSIGNPSEDYNISREEFNTLLNFLSTKKVIDLSDWENQKDYYALTFDDVRESFYQNAFPVLKSLKLPFTIFVSPGLLNKNGYITTNQLISISSWPLCTLGSHTVGHPFYAELGALERENELLESQRMLEAITHRKVELFAFPYGSFYSCGFKHKKNIYKYYQYGFSSIGIALTRPSLLPKCFLPRINVNSNYISRLYEYE